MNIQTTNIAVLITVHNRRETTLQCLRNLYANQLPEIELEVFLVDDGSVDGTKEAISRHFPNVHIILGTGDLFWNRGMLLSWNEAAKSSHDFYLWLNDDTILFENAIQIMMESYGKVSKDSIIVGCTCSANNPSVVTYGGFNKTIMMPNGALQETTIINGNFVLIPDAVYKKIGGMDPFFRHSFGDREYGIRAHQNGIHLYITPTFIGTCERHSSSKRCFDPAFGLMERLRFFYSPLGNPPAELYHMYKKERGIGYAIKIVCANLFFVLFPKMAKRLMA